MHISTLVFCVKKKYKGNMTNFKVLLHVLLLRIHFSTNADMLLFYSYKSLPSIALGFNILKNNSCCYKFKIQVLINFTHISLLQLSNYFLEILATLISQ